MRALLGDGDGAGAREAQLDVVLNAERELKKQAGSRATHAAKVAELQDMEAENMRLRATIVQAPEM